MKIVFSSLYSGIRHIFDRSTALLAPSRIVAAAKAETEASLIRADAEQEVLDRAVTRLRAREGRRQLNIEAISEEAVKLPPPNPTVSRAAPSWAASDDDLCATGTSLERRRKADSKFMPQSRERIRHVARGS